MLYRWFLNTVAFETLFLVTFVCIKAEAEATVVWVKNELQRDTWWLVNSKGNLCKSLKTELTQCHLAQRSPLTERSFFSGFKEDEARSPNTKFQSWKLSLLRNLIFQPTQKCFPEKKWWESIFYLVPKKPLFLMNLCNPHRPLLRELTKQ